MTEAKTTHNVVHNAVPVRDSGELLGAVLDLLQRLPLIKKDAAHRAVLSGVGERETEAIALTGCFLDWLAEKPGGVSVRDCAMEAERAGMAVVEQEQVAFGVKMSGLLGLRVLELAHARKQTVSETLEHLVATSVEQALESVQQAGKKSRRRLRIS